jgi:hypothetical protein
VVRAGENMTGLVLHCVHLFAYTGEGVFQCSQIWIHELLRINTVPDISQNDLYP